ncbi:MAG: amino acid adenylation domain-containing protein, partial [Acetobacteraceae bacterium]|nr:amino acid adenylation domain-containing protein [Acetobacteraceae bacterium]
YAAFASGRAAALEPLPAQHRDFVLWQRRRLERDGAGHRTYWLEQLGDGPVPLDLPTDFPRSPLKTYRGAVERILLPPMFLRSLDALARREQATLFMLLLALVKALLFRISGTEDVSVGSPVAGRDHPDLRRQIGLFVNTLVLRSRLAGEQPFLELLRSIRDRAAGWYAHQDYPFDLLVQDVNPARDTSRNPLFEVMVVLQNTANTPVELPGIVVEPIEVADVAAQFDLLWNFAADADGLHLSLRYNRDLFQPDTVARLLRCWRVLTEAALADPATATGRLPLLGADERAAILQVAPLAGELAPAHRSLVEAFEAQAALRPAGIAVSDGTRSLTYGELDARANALARRIRAHMRAVGAEDEALVAICIPRSAFQVVAILGALKAGAAYLPLDPDAPADRLRFMVEDAGAILLLVGDDSPALSAPSLPPQWRVDTALPAVPPSAGLALPIGPDQAAYVIYTSGSTGEPKGTVITHGNVLRLFAATRAWFNFTRDDVWTLFHSIAFDFSVWEMFGALLHGGHLVVVQHSTSRAPDEFHALLRRERVTVLNQTPSAFLQLDAHDASAGMALPDVRFVIFGGEALDTASLAGWFARHGDESPALINMYGITETTVHVTYRRLRAEDARRSGSPIGEPIPDLYLRVLDPAMEPVPTGVAGELYVGGAGLARGYLGRPELTSQRFIADPFQPGGRLYRTGDRVRRTADGELEFLGRLDDQVKIRGFRIEPGEIASRLTRHPAIAQAVVTPVRRDGTTELAAYYVTREATPGPLELRSHLQAALPAYMIPRWFLPLERLPLTLNGKLDLRALPAPEAMQAEQAVTPRPASGGTEGTILSAWRQALADPELGPDHNVFDRGAHSMLAVQVRGRLRQALDREIPVVALFQYPTAAALAAHLERPEDAGGTAPDPGQRADRHRQVVRQASLRRAAREAAD